MADVGRNRSEIAASAHVEAPIGQQVPRDARRNGNVSERVAGRSIMGCGYFIFFGDPPPVSGRATLSATVTSGPAELQRCHFSTVFPRLAAKKKKKKENIVGGGARADEMESGGAECGMRRRNFRIIGADFGDPTNRNCRHIFGISFLSADHLLPKWRRRRHFLEILRRPHSSLQCALVVRSRSIY